MLASPSEVARDLLAAAAWLEAAGNLALSLWTVEMAGELLRLPGESSVSENRPWLC